MENTARTRRLYPIAPLPRHVITPLPRDFKPNMYKDPRVYILNPVFNFIVEEKSVQELNCCCICLENVIYAEEIKPCDVCNMYMHEKCFLEYCKSKPTKPKCVTCEKEIDLNEINVELKEEIDNSITVTTESPPNIIDEFILEEEEYNCRILKKRIVCCGTVLLFITIFVLIIFAMQFDGVSTRNND